MQQLADQISIAIAQGQLLENLEGMVEARTAELQQLNHNLQQEIQERQQVEMALRLSEEQLRLITNALPVLIAYVDAQQCYRFNNQAFQTWFGRSPQDLYGNSLVQVWPRDLYDVMRPQVELTLAGHTVTYEQEVTLVDQRSHEVSVTHIPHIDAQGQIQGFFSLTSDISDRKAIERMKDEFISVVSHELRTPLTSLHSALKILATGRLGKLSGDGQQMLAIADENTDRLVRLVNNVLDLQRIESGDVRMEKTACDAADLMTQATEAMQPMAQQHGIHLLSVPKSIAIWADPDYIVQTLTNLISNAIKFSSPGTTVSLRVQRDAPQPQPSQSRKRRVQAPPFPLPPATLAPKNYPPRPSLASHPLPTPRHSNPTAPPPTAYVLFQLQDQGQGIPADKLESIFERFQQVDSSDARKKGGTGLGLTICRKIVEQHGGQIWVESSLGQGSCFYIRLPMVDADPDITQD